MELKTYNEWLLNNQQVIFGETTLNNDEYGHCLYSINQVKDFHPKKTFENNNKIRDFFTSDLHFFHDNVVKYSGRPWKPDEQTEIFITLWNKQVRKNDNVYHLGDFAFLRKVKDIESLVSLIKRLNGKKYFIKGNHCDDKVWGHIEKQTDLACWVKDYAKIIIDGQKIIMSHYAFRVWDSSHYGSFNLFGHSHGNLINTEGKQLDVGIDNSIKVLGEYRFFTFEDIVKYMLKK